MLASRTSTRPRVKPGAAEQAIDDLRWLGLDFDGEPVVQTQRLQLYEAALEKLKRAELVYPCTCTRADIERAASARTLDHEGPVYPGTCSHRRAADAENLQAAVLLALPRAGAIADVR